MKGSKGPLQATDLLVCFPPRTHLTLMPPTNISSPGRPSSEAASTRHQHRQHRRKLSSRGGGGGKGHASPLLWAKTNKPHNSQHDYSEPTSPKVTCAGQIKVRPKPNSSCKNWQSVMEEIEGLHDQGKRTKKLAWIESLGFKKDAMQFLTCLRNIRFNFRCFGSFPSATVVTSDEDEDEGEEEIYANSSKEESCKEIDGESSRTVFSKWFMILQEDQDGKERLVADDDHDDDDDHGSGGPCAPPPPKALLLMRCRSAPDKSWLEETEEYQDCDDDDDDDKKKERAKELKEKEIIHFQNVSNYSKCSSDIAKETWVVGGVRDMISRNWSCKR